MTRAAAPVAERLAAQLLSGPPARDAVAVAGRLLAVQGQDPRGARLSIRARTDGLSAADVDRALTEDRTLLITWLNRGTLHLVRSEDHHWLHALMAPPLVTGNARRLAQEGVTPDAADRGVAVMRARPGRGGAADPPRSSASGSRPAACAPTARRSCTSSCSPACAASRSAARWWGASTPTCSCATGWASRRRSTASKALAELARRYLAGHGPASDRDLARWAGLPLRDARAGLSAIASELDERDDGLVDLAGREPAPPLPPPRLLGPFDPVLLGWTSREPLLGDRQGSVTVGGLFRPFALVRGRAAATWRLAGGEVTIEPFAKLSRAVAAALDAEASDVLRFMASWT